MKNKNVTLSLLLLTFLLPIWGCDKSEDLTAYQKPFLGQWQEIARGNEWHPELTPGDVLLEFFPDWTLKRTFAAITYPDVYMEARISYDRYSVDREFLYYTYTEASNSHTWRYSFYEDKLRIDYEDGLMQDSMDTPFFMYINGLNKQAT
jgi:hypothetical protein